MIPFPGYSAMAFFGCIFARKSSRPLSQTTINHEGIHIAQAIDCHGWVFFYLMYLWFWIAKRGYRNIPFEKEAYANESDMEYLERRVRKAWKSYK